MSSEIDFGWWLLPNGQRGRVSFVPSMGLLYLLRPDREEVLASVADRAAAEALLEGLDPDDRTVVPSLRVRIARLA